MKTKEQCLEIAARIWCDQDMRSEVMDSQLAMTIANMLYKKFNVASATATPAACNPWLGRKANRDLLEKLNEVFMEAWGDNENYGAVASELDEELTDFFFACSIDQVDSDEDTITVRFKVPAPEHLDV